MDNLMDEIMEVVNDNIGAWGENSNVHQEFYEELKGLLSNYHILPKTGESGYGVKVKVPNGYIVCIYESLEEAEAHITPDHNLIFWTEIKEDV